MMIEDKWNMLNLKKKKGYYWSLTGVHMQDPPKNNLIQYFQLKVMLTSGTFSPNSPIGNRTRIHTDRMAPFLFVWDQRELENAVNQPNVPTHIFYIARPI